MASLRIPALGGPPASPNQAPPPPLSMDDVEVLHGALCGALGGDSQVRKRSEGAIAAMEGRPGYCVLLLEIAGKKNSGVDENVRALAIMCFKNTINKSWRRRVDGRTIDDQEKALLRSKLMGMVDEPSRHVVVQLALALARISRFDLPLHWPDFFPQVLSLMQSGSAHQKLGSLLVLHHVIKEMTSKVVSRRYFQRVSASLFPVLAEVWTHAKNTVLHYHASKLDSSSAQVETDCETFNLSTKILCNLLAYGFENLSENNDVIVFIKALLDCISALISACCEHGAIDVDTLKMSILYKPMHKAVIRFSNALSTMVHTRPSHFTPLLTPFLRLYATMVVDPPRLGGGAFYLPFCVEAMVFLKNSIKPADDAKVSDAFKAEVSALLDTDGVVNLCRQLVVHYFVLAQHEQDMWVEDGEAYFYEQSVTEWRTEARPCAEALLLTLLGYRTDTVAPVIVDMLSQVWNGGFSTEQESVIRDAVYTAAGVCVYGIHEVVDINEWWRRDLHAILARPRQPQNFMDTILRRRVIWVVSCFASYVGNELIGELYQSILPLCNDPDIVIRLSILDTAQELLGTYQFDMNEFLPFAGGFIQFLFAMVESCDVTRTKISALQCLAIIVHTLGQQVEALQEGVMVGVINVWNTLKESEGHVKSNVLEVLMNLVKALGPKSLQIHTHIVPVIQYATEANHPEFVFLCEDGLRLWYYTLLHARQFSEPLWLLFPNIASILERGLDSLSLCLSIIEAYILLGKIDFLKTYGEHFGAVLRGLFSSKLADKALRKTLSVVDTLILQLPQEGALFASSLLEGSIEVIVTDKEPDNVICMHLNLIARAIFSNTDFCRHVLQKENQLDRFLCVWLDKVDSMALPFRRKLSALALCSMLSLGHTIPLKHLDEIMPFFVDVMHEMTGSRANFKKSYEYMLMYGEPDEDGYVDAEDIEEDRKAMLLESDPSITMDFKGCVRMALEQCKACVGQDVMRQAMASVDPTVMRDMHL